DTIANGATKSRCKADSSTSSSRLHRNKPEKGRTETETTQPSSKQKAEDTSSENHLSKDKARQQILRSLAGSAHFVHESGERAIDDSGVHDEDNSYDSSNSHSYLICLAGSTRTWGHALVMANRPLDRTSWTSSAQSVK